MAEFSKVTSPYDATPLYIKSIDKESDHISGGNCSYASLTYMVL
jgi:hypothetical protein